ncbi:MAG: L,D-transpeptidase [Pseudomonadota bacterium]|nr:L,D-transpeptidase [Pseudomonadales bacterium]MDY6918820.1 L,D-transpeptidase [Pseudomonadota bacterium]
MPRIPTAEIRIDIGGQLLELWQQGRCICSWPVSTARNGPGNRSGSNQTPLGRHRIRACIGADAPVGTVFVGRRPTGETYSAELATRHPGRDWILTRILWLCGEETGVNRGGDVDSQRRYIYIHGTPDSEPMGIPLSHGCIRMRNGDVIELFDRVGPGTPVLIRQ